ncbi:MAG: inositol monophosphatase family protein [Acidimicrobiia bacterium]
MTVTSSPANDLELALSLANAADHITTARFLADDLVVETKPDLTPVTEADRAAEVEIRNLLASARPDDAVLGEEHGLTGGEHNARRWILDPIDGTKNFVRGLPVWGTLIGLQVDGVLTVGVVSAPALGRRWYASRGGAAFVEGAYAPRGPLRVSRVAHLGDACVTHSDLALAEGCGYADATMAIAKASWRTRGYGDFWMHVLVAEGAVDAAFEPDVKPWDLAAVSIIVEEAGGRFSDFAGRPSIDGGSAVSSNGLLHDDLLRYLA